MARNEVDDDGFNERLPPDPHRSRPVIVMVATRGAGQRWRVVGRCWVVTELAGGGMSPV
ncbi:hypothetical protein Dimus_036022, partial [Dionaea muscipula]